jgi:hypothetical protein
VKDFNHTVYKKYLIVVKSSFSNIMRFDEFFKTKPQPESFCLIRHDVDRKPENALIMAELEKEIGISSTYYFRVKDHTFKPAIIKEIYNLGHEIGYHYESLSDKKGKMEEALEDFEIKLDKFRKIVPIKTISMHGRPLSPFDNRELWKDKLYHKKLLNELTILGDIYLDIDYSEIVYISDTGRNWNSNKNNVRDKVSSVQSFDFNNGKDLLIFFSTTKYNKLVFSVHPDRWTNSFFEYIIQFVYDKAINIAKMFILKF